MAEKTTLTDEQHQIAEVWVGRLVRGLRMLADGIEARWHELHPDDGEGDDGRKAVTWMAEWRERCCGIIWEHGALTQARPCADCPERRCGELSPESRVPCHLPVGHDGAHEARRGPYALSSWAHTLPDCTRCGGSGEVHETGYSLNPRSGVSVPDPQCTRDYTCPRCHGEGVEPGDCPRCGESTSGRPGYSGCTDPSCPCA